MMKKRWNFVTWLAMLCLSLLPVAVYAVTPTLTVETKDATVDSVVELAVTAEQLSPLLGIQITMQYDSAALELIAFVRGTCEGFPLAVENTKNEGVVKYVAASGSTVELDGTLFTLRFKPKSGASGTYPVRISDVKASVSDLSDYAISCVDGAVRLPGKRAVPLGGNGAADIRRVEPADTEPTEPPVQSVFSDLAGHWAEDAVGMLARRAVVAGRGEGLFDPDGKVTRAEITKIILLAFSPDGDGKAEVYSDVAEDAWYADYVATAAVTGIVQGYEDGTFRPDHYVSRQELSVMLVRAVGAAQLRALARKDMVFHDATSIAPWADESVGLLAAAGILGGDQNGNFLPENGATRAETAKMTAGLLDLIEKQ